MDTREQCAQITRAELEFERGYLTSWLTLEWPGASQGFGGYSLGGYTNTGCGVWVRGVMRAAGVDRWSDLCGKTVRVRRDATGKVKAIGHATTERWFIPAEEFEYMKPLKPIDATE